MGTLYLVATPIGNLEDVSARALRILNEVHLIAAEDTRRTGKLLSHFDIHTPVTSYYEHNKLRKVDELLLVLAEGNAALVSDAGTPLINDPGYELVMAALEAGHTVSPIPGPCAPIAALTASGLPSDKFIYLGYLPRKKKKRLVMLEEVKELSFTLIFLETPHRLLGSLQDMSEVLGNRRSAAARELTKLHEEIFRGSLRELLSHYSAQKPRGEFTIVVGGYNPSSERWAEERLDEEILYHLERDDTPAHIASRLARRSGWQRRVIYKKILAITNEEQEQHESL